MNHPVFIVGGGLAGLTAARSLHLAGSGFLLLEARDRLGGRILSADTAGHASDDGFDLGAVMVLARHAAGNERTCQ